MKVASKHNFHFIGLNSTKEEDAKCQVTCTFQDNKIKDNLKQTHGSVYNGILVPVRTSFGLHRRGGKTYNVSNECKVDVDMLNAVKSVLAMAMDMVRYFSGETSHSMMHRLSLYEL